MIDPMKYKDTEPHRLFGLIGRVDRHEVSHAVAATRLGMHVVKITFPGIDGRMYYKLGRHTTTADFTVVRLAGAAADALSYGMPFTPEYFLEKVDTQYGADYRNGDEEILTEWPEVCDEAMRLVATNWKLINAIVAAIGGKNIIYGKRLREILQQC